jgi:hypothetical protein
LFEALNMHETLVFFLWLPKTVPLLPFSVDNVDMVRLMHVVDISPKSPEWTNLCLTELLMTKLSNKTC